MTEGLSNEQFHKDTEAYKTASKKERVRLEQKWGERAGYFRTNEHFFNRSC